MKVLIAYLTTEADDPNMSSDFIAGYELNGGTWDGTIDILENISQDAITDEWLQDKVDSGYSAVIRNTGSDNDALNSYSKYIDALDQGLAYITAVGSNEYNKVITYMKNYNVPIRCGSGKRGTENATGYPCMFYDQAASEPSDEIEYIERCGTVYNISEIYRLNSTTLLMKFEGVTDVRDIGFFDHGIPFTINALSGSDISPLPTGDYFTGGILADGIGIYFTVPAMTGTITGWQSATGNITYGSDTSDILIVKVSSYQALNGTGNGIILSDVSGFSNDINGITEIYSLVNYDGFRDKFKISKNLGTGTYAGGGLATFASQSYATPYIAGQLCWLKDRMGSDWYDVLGRAIKTASGFESDGYTYQNGYGYLNADQAVFETDTSLDTPEIILDANSGTGIRFHWYPVPYANEYEVYYKNELFETISGHNTTFYQAVGYREPKGVPRRWKVRAKNGNKYSEFSNEFEQNYYCNPGILAKEVSE